MSPPARIALLLALVFLLPCGPVETDGKEAPASLGSGPPLLALWRMSDGHVLRSEAPNLRIAIWEDGRVLAAVDPAKWGRSIREGRISARRLADLKKRIVETGVFDLKGTCYLTPDAPVLCLLAHFGGREQILYWDEVESSNYGINIAPKPHHLKFKECWKAVNRLALAARPQDAGPFGGSFGPVPQSWYPKPAIQSE